MKAWKYYEEKRRDRGGRFKEMADSVFAAAADVQQKQAELDRRDAAVRSVEGCDGAGI